jgi:hypothetical protein
MPDLKAFNTIDQFGRIAPRRLDAPVPRSRMTVRAAGACLHGPPARSSIL